MTKGLKNTQLHVAKQNPTQTVSTLTAENKIGYQLQLGKGGNVTRSIEFRIQIGCSRTTVKNRKPEKGP